MSVGAMVRVFQRSREDDSVDLLCLVAKSIAQKWIKVWVLSLGFILGIIGIMEKKMETTIWAYMGLYIYIFLF